MSSSLHPTGTPGPPSSSGGTSLDASPSSSASLPPPIQVHHHQQQQHQQHHLQQQQLNSPPAAKKSFEMSPTANHFFPGAGLTVGGGGAGSGGGGSGSFASQNNSFNTPSVTNLADRTSSTSDSPYRANVGDQRHLLHHQQQHQHQQGVQPFELTSNDEVMMMKTAQQQHQQQQGQQQEAAFLLFQQQQQQQQQNLEVVQQQQNNTNTMLMMAGVDEEWFNQTQDDQQDQQQEQGPHFQFRVGHDVPVVTHATKHCRHFMKGRCTWGDQCRFKHEVPHLNEPAVSVSVGVPPKPTNLLQKSSSSSMSGVPTTGIDNPLSPQLSLQQQQQQQQQAPLLQSSSSAQLIPQMQQQQQQQHPSPSFPSPSASSLITSPLSPMLGVTVGAKAPHPTPALSAFSAPPSVVVGNGSFSGGGGLGTPTFRSMQLSGGGQSSPSLSSSGAPKSPSVPRVMNNPYSTTCVKTPTFNPHDMAQQQGSSPSPLQRGQPSPFQDGGSHFVTVNVMQRTSTNNSITSGSFYRPPSPGPDLPPAASN